MSSRLSALLLARGAQTFADRRELRFDQLFVHRLGFSVALGHGPV